MIVLDTEYWPTQDPEVLARCVRAIRMFANKPVNVLLKGPFGLPPAMAWPAWIKPSAEDAKIVDAYCKSLTPILRAAGTVAIDGYPVNGTPEEVENTEAHIRRQCELAKAATPCSEIRVALVSLELQWTAANDTCRVGPPTGIYPAIERSGAAGWLRVLGAIPTLQPPAVGLDAR
jgi:hypothetical protein